MCKCKYCRWMNTSERSGYKCFCEWYGAYYDPDTVSDCSHYRD